MIDFEKMDLATLLAMIPREGEYAYIEARVGSENYRKESRFVIDRRPDGYENLDANAWLAALAKAADRLR